MIWGVLATCFVRVSLFKLWLQMKSNLQICDKGWHKPTWTIWSAKSKLEWCWACCSWLWHLEPPLHHREVWKACRKWGKERHRARQSSVPKHTQVVVFQSYRICDRWFTGYDWLAIAFLNLTWTNTRFLDTLEKRWVTYNTVPTANSIKDQNASQGPQRASSSLLECFQISQTYWFVHYLKEHPKDYITSFRLSSGWRNAHNSLDTVGSINKKQRFLVDRWWQWPRKLKSHYSTHVHVASCQVSTRNYISAYYIHPGSLGSEYQQKSWWRLHNANLIIEWSYLMLLVLLKKKD